MSHSWFPSVLFMTQLKKHVKLFTFMMDWPYGTMYFLVLGTIIIENFSLLDKCIIQTLRICFGPTVGQDFPNCQRRRRKQSCYYNNTLPEAISEATRPVAVVDGISRESSAWLQPRWWPAVLTAEIESHTTISQNFPDCLGLNHAKRAAASI